MIMQTIWIAWIAVRELLYEKVFYLLVCFAVVSIGLSLMLGQMTYAEQSKITVDFLLAGMEISMVLFSVFMGISLFHRELTLGSISMVLSKPLSRMTFLLGKYLGQVLVQTMVTILMGLITMGVCARFGETVSYFAITQTMFLIALEVAVLTAITYLFAVIAGGVTTAVATLCLYGLGKIPDTITENLGTSLSRTTWRVVKLTIPDLEIFDMKALASYGQALTYVELGWISLYAATCVLFFLGAAVLCFDRRDILT